MCYAAGKESGSPDSTTITEAGDRGKCRGLTGFWCTDGYAVCGYAEAAATSKDIVVSVDDVGVSKTPGLRVNAPPSVLADLTFHGLFRSKAAWLEPQPLLDSTILPGWLSQLAARRQSSGAPQPERHNQRRRSVWL